MRLCPLDHSNGSSRRTYDNFDVAAEPGQKVHCSSHGATAGVRRSSNAAPTAPGELHCNTGRAPTQRRRSPASFIAAPAELQRSADTSGEAPSQHRRSSNATPTRPAKPHCNSGEASLHRRLCFRRPRVAPLQHRRCSRTASRQHRRSCSARVGHSPRTSSQRRALHCISGRCLPHRARLAPRTGVPSCSDRRAAARLQPDASSHRRPVSLTAATVATEKRRSMSIVRSSRREERWRRRGSGEKR